MWVEKQIEWSIKKPWGVKIEKKLWGVRRRVWKKKGEWCIKKKGRVSVFCAGEWNIKKKKGWRHECVVFCEGCTELKKKGCELKKKEALVCFVQVNGILKKKKKVKEWVCCVLCRVHGIKKKCELKKKKKRVCAC